MEKLVFYMAVALVAVLALTVWTNIVVEVTKKLIAWDKFPVEVWVAIVAIVSTLAAAAAGAQIINIKMMWYYWLATAALGVLVCYAAMYGYDTLYKKIKETYKIIQEIVAGNYKEKTKERQCTGKRKKE